MILRRGFAVVLISLSLYAAAGCGSDQLNPHSPLACLLRASQLDPQSLPSAAM